MGRFERSVPAGQPVVSVVPNADSFEGQRPRATPETKPPSTEDRARSANPNPIWSRGLRRRGAYGGTRISQPV